MLAPETPFPLAGGGALRTASLLQYLAGKYAVDLIVFRQPGAPDPRQALPDELVQRIVVIDLPANRRSMAARALRNAVRVARSVPPLVDRFSGFDREIADAVEGRRYRLGVIEHFWCAPYGGLISKVCEKTILNLHNIESVLHRRCAQSERSPAGLVHRVFGEASLRLEREWLPRFSSVLATSATARSWRGPLRPRRGWRCIPMPSRWCHCRSERIVRQSCFQEIWNTTRTVRQSGISGGRSGPGCARDGPIWCGGWWGKTRRGPAVYNGDPRIEVSGEVEDAVRELARARWRWYRFWPGAEPG